MNLELTPEQALLKQSVDRLALREATPEKLRRASAGSAARRQDLWSEFAALGCLGIGIPEVYGGSGGGAAESMIVAAGMGNALLVEPYLSTVVLGARLVLEAGSDAQRSRLLPRIADGRCRVAVALQETKADFDPLDVRSCATERGSAWVLSGSKRLVLDAALADEIIVPAVIGRDGGPDGRVGLFLVKAAAAGLSMRFYRTIDGRTAADIVFANIEAEPLSDPVVDAGGMIREAVNRALAAVCAEAWGASAAVIDLTRSHLQTRKQFGQALASFQALQHRFVDMHIELEHLTSVTMVAAAALDAEPRRARQLCAIAKARMAKAARFIGESGVQLHGGIGMTDEHPVGHYFKRLLMLELLFGSRDHHLHRLAQGSVGTDPEFALAEGTDVERAALDKQAGGT